MAYVPDPTNTTQPTDAILAETAQAEFRALKVYLAGLVSGSGLGVNIFRKNKIINGAMKIDQRNVAAAFTPTTTAYTLDRWQANISQPSKFTFQKSTSIQPSFFNSIAMTVAAQYAPLIGDRFIFVQKIEGLNISDLAWGTADAQSVAVSFFFKSSIAGNYAFSLRDGVLLRSYVHNFAYNTANVTQYVSAVIPGDTIGAWAQDTSAGILFAIDLGSGGNLNVGVFDTWSAGDFTRGAASLDFVNQVNGSVISVTGIQVETGGAASQFELIDFSEELLRCQRYYNKTFNQTVAPVQNAGTGTGEFLWLAGVAAAGNDIAQFQLPVVMRAPPTITFFNPVAANAQARDFSFGGDCSGTAASLISDRAFKILAVGNAGSAVANQLLVHLTASAEL